MRCSDCGTPYRKGLCPNCHEEAYILAYQTDTYDGTFSNEFVAAAEQQERAARKARKAQSHGPAQPQADGDTDG